MKRLLPLLLILLATPAWALDTLTAHITAHTGDVPLTLELATTPSTREYGLMNRKELAPHTGMLFVFPTSERLSFWMKNTLIPLDMLFINSNGVIVHVGAQATPLSLTPIDSTKPVTAVIEIPGGEAAKDGIHVGDTVHYDVPKATHVE